MPSQNIRIEKLGLALNFYKSDRARQRYEGLCRMQRKRNERAKTMEIGEDLRINGKFK